MVENTEIVSKEEGPKGPINLFALFPKLKLQFPFWKQQEPQPRLVAVEDEASKTGKPAIAMFPKAEPVVPTVAVETEEPMTRTSNPIIVWQVYALGGFLVLKWIWARWQERRDEKEDENDDEKEDENEDEKGGVF
ncbi:hypothetical protein M0R45_001559 [Rubus argutus]|uniref:Uncharacterized protein n=1 Tax=Rubus argutus TaxID=59490 RepID=A0AAW1VKD8_RUBAR